MARLIAAAFALLLVGACAGPAATSAPSAGHASFAAPSTTASVAPAASAAASSTAVDVLEKDFEIDPAVTTVPGNVTFNVHSDGPTPHNFNLRDATGTVVLSSKDLRKGDSDSLAAQLAPGTYTFFCAFPGHESLGMHGTLTVTTS